MKIEINKKVIDSIDLSKFFNKIIGSSKIHFIKESGEHYKLLAYLSSLFDNSTLIDIGTCDGGSATAMSYNEKNQVVSFGIHERLEEIIYQQRELQIPPKFNNIDFIVTQNFLKYKNLILKSKIISLDIDHSGELEKELIDCLIDNNYQGILILDDINYYEPLKKLFAEISIDKYDVTQYAHWSGTGLINFDKNINIILG